MTLTIGSCWFTDPAFKERDNYVETNGDAKIAVLCGHSPEYFKLAKHTIYDNKSNYCKRYGYDLHVVLSIRSKFKDPKSHAGGFSWSRLEEMLDLVECGKYEWVWCVGCDTLITNFTIKLEDIIAPALTPEAESAPLPVCPYFPNSPAPPTVVHWKAPQNHKWSGKKHLLISAERVTSMQADSFFVRGTPEGAAYLRDILNHYELYKHFTWVENQTMIDLRDKHAAITYMLPQWKINCVDYSRWYHNHRAYRDNSDCFGNRGNWQRGDFLIHWPASSLEQRMVWLEKYEKEIVR